MKPERAMRTVLYIVGFALLFWAVASVIGFLLPHSGVIEVVGLVGGGIYGWRQAEQRRKSNEAGVDQPLSIEVDGLVGGASTGGVKQSGTARADEGRVDQPRSTFGLLCVLVFHGFGALTWFAFLGFSSDYAGTDRQFEAGSAFGLVTWLAATALIVWLWRSRRSPLLYWSIPFAWWYPSFLLMIAIVY